MFLFVALVVAVLSSCENEVVISPENSSKPDYSIYLIRSDGISKYIYDEDSLVATEVLTISSSYTGRAINAGSFIAIPTMNGYQKLSWDLKDEGSVGLGFSPRMIVLYDGTIDTVAESTMLFNGTVVEFDDTINDAKSGPDGLYVAAGKRIYTLPGKNPTMAGSTQTIFAIAVDNTGSIYMGVNGKVLTSLGNVNVNGIVKKLVLKDDYLYALTDMGYIYRIGVNDISDAKRCGSNVSDFTVIDDKIFYVSDFEKKFGVYDTDSCEGFSKNITGNKFLGILVKEE